MRLMGGFLSTNLIVKKLHTCFKLSVRGHLQPYTHALEGEPSMGTCALQISLFAGELAYILSSLF